MKVAELREFRRYIEINRFGVAKLIRRKLAQARISFGRNDWDDSDIDSDVWRIIEDADRPVQVQREAELRDLEENPDDYTDDPDYDRKRIRVTYDCAESITETLNQATDDAAEIEEILRLVQETEKDADLEKQERIALAQIDAAIMMREALDGYLAMFHKRDSDNRDEAIEKIQELIFNDDEE